MTDIQRAKRVAIWGAAAAGRQCCERARENGLEVAFFLDRSPPPSRRCMGLPVLTEDAVLRDGSALRDVDLVFLSFAARHDHKKEQLRAVGYDRAVVEFTNGVPFENLLRRGGALLLGQLFSFDGGARDRALADRVVDGLLAGSGRVVAYGAGRLGRYLAELRPDFAARAAFVDDALVARDAAGLAVSAPSDHAAADVVFVAATRWRAVWEMQRRARARWPNARVVTLYDLDTLDLRDLGDLARAAESTIYPIDIPEIRVEPGLDLVLLDLPSRFLGMMPNGLGFVHNLLEKTGIRHQTLDLDLVFYHRYHSERILDGLPHLVTASGYEMKADPWGVDRIEDEWSRTEVLDHFEPELDELARELARAKPKIVGLSLHGTNLLCAERLVARIRRDLPDTVVLVGGYDCVYADVGPKVFTQFDYMVIGEAETSLPGFIERLAAGERPRNVPGVVSPHDSALPGFRAAPLPHDLDAIDFPRYQWADLRVYRNYNGYQLTPILLGRGCRWSRCTFCAERFEWRTNSAPRMVEEIQWLYDRGCRLFQYNDSDLSSDPLLLGEVCDEVVRRDLTVAFAGQLRVHKLHDRAYFDRLRAAGFSALRFGVDAWSPHTLRLQNKGYTIDMVHRVLRDCHEAGIAVAVNLVIGVPGETEEDVDISIENLIRARAYVSAVENINTLILARGGLYWDDPAKYGIRFRADPAAIRAEIRYAKMVPPDLWYSEDPYIDQEVRVRRMERMVAALHQSGIYMGDYAVWKAKRLQAGVARVQTVVAETSVAS